MIALFKRLFRKPAPRPVSIRLMHSGKLLVSFENLEGQVEVEGACQPLYWFAGTALRKIDSKRWVKVRGDMEIVVFNPTEQILHVRLPNTHHGPA